MKELFAKAKLDRIENLGNFLHMVGEIDFAKLLQKP